MAATFHADGDPIEQSADRLSVVIEVAETLESELGAEP